MLPQIKSLIDNNELILSVVHHLSGLQDHSDTLIGFDANQLELTIRVGRDDLIKLYQNIFMTYITT